MQYRKHRLANYKSSMASSSSVASTLVLSDKEALHQQQQHALNIRLIESFSTWFFGGIFQRYISLKEYSRIIRFFGNTTEGICGRVGLKWIVRTMFNQWKRFGDPVLQTIDRKVGEQLITIFVQAVMKAGIEPQGLMLLEDEEMGGVETHLTLSASFKERLHILLTGEITPAIQSLREKELRCVSNVDSNASSRLCVSRPCRIT